MPKPKLDLSYSVFLDKGAMHAVELRKPFKKRSMARSRGRYRRALKALRKSLPWCKDA